MTLKGGAQTGTAPDPAFTSCGEQHCERRAVRDGDCVGVGGGMLADALHEQGQDAVNFHTRLE